MMAETVGCDEITTVQGDFDLKSILGVRVVFETREDVLKSLVRALKFRQKVSVAFANTNLINCVQRTPELRDELEDFIVFNDGIGIDLACWFKFGRFFPENLNGTDLTPELLRECPGARVFLFGASQASVDGAAQFFEDKCDVSIVGAQHGYIDDTSQVYKRMNDARADIVLVAMGNPKQEFWIAENRRRLNAPIAMGVGALFDFVSGEKKRAPEWIQKARLEWASRVLNEPQRLAKRYTTDMAYFFYGLAKEIYAEQLTTGDRRR